MATSPASSSTMGSSTVWDEHVVLGMKPTLAQLEAEINTFFAAPE